MAKTNKVPLWKIVHVLNELLGDTSPDVDDDSDPNKNVANATRPRARRNDCQKMISPKTRVMELVSSCTRTQRWTAAAKFFPAVARQIAACPLAVWKIGAACLAYHPESNKTLMSSFANAMVHANLFASPEILVDHVIYLMCNGEYDEATRFIENYKRRCPKSYSETLWAVLQGSRGLLEYINWRSHLRLQVNSNEESIDPLAAISNEAKLLNYAEKAVSYLKSSFCRSGNYDVYMVKLVEILEYYERLEEADQALTSYIQLNHLHPTPYVFTFHFIQKHYPNDIQRQLYILEELAKICPCDYNIIKLCKLLPPEAIDFRIKYLFDFVDYNEWRNNLEVWKTLVEVVLSKELKTKSIHSQVLSKFIMERSNWWISYHFRLCNLKLNDPVSREVAVYKAVMVSIMFYSDHLYVKTVAEKLSEMGDEDNVGRLNDLLVSARQVCDAMKAAIITRDVKNQPNFVKKVVLNSNVAQQSLDHSYSCVPSMTTNSLVITSVPYGAGSQLVHPGFTQATSPKLVSVSGTANVPGQSNSAFSPSSETRKLLNDNTLRYLLSNGNNLRFQGYVPARPSPPARLPLPACTPSPPLPGAQLNVAPSITITSVQKRPSMPLNKLYPASARLKEVVDNTNNNTLPPFTHPLQQMVSNKLSLAPKKKFMAILKPSTLQSGAQVTPSVPGQSCDIVIPVFKPRKMSVKPSPMKKTELDTSKVKRFGGYTYERNNSEKFVNKRKLKKFCVIARVSNEEIKSVNGKQAVETSSLSDETFIKQFEALTSMKLKKVSVLLKRLSEDEIQRHCHNKIPKIEVLEVEDDVIVID